MTTVLEIAERVNRHLCGVASISDAQLKTDIKYALDFTLKELAKECDHIAFRCEAEFVTTIGQRDYHLAKDVSHFFGDSFKYTAENQEYPLRYIPQAHWDMNYGDVLYNATVDQPRLLTIVGKDKSSGKWKLRLHPAPAESNTIRYAYTGKPTDISAAADSDEIDPRWDESLLSLLVYGAALQFPEQLSQQQLTIINKNYEQGRRRLGRSAMIVKGADLQQEAYMGHPALSGRAHHNFAIDTSRLDIPT